jgi:membrane protease YdiL (CAAX protease family)
LPKITLVGGVFAGLYLLSGSIWLPMLLHAAVDILQGRLAYEVIHRAGSADYGLGDEAAEPTP